VPLVIATITIGGPMAGDLDRRAARLGSDRSCGW
jgi:hypothetical protein